MIEANVELTGPRVGQGVTMEADQVTNAATSGSGVERVVRPLAGPNTRRVLRSARLCEELGHGGDTLAALKHMKRMESALKVIHTWAAFPPLDVRDVRALCARALKADEAA